MGTGERPRRLAGLALGEHVELAALLRDLVLGDDALLAWAHDVADVRRQLEAGAGARDLRHPLQDGRARAVHRIDGDHLARAIAGERTLVAGTVAPVVLQEGAEVVLELELV